MGLLVEGQWHDAWYDTKSTRGRFVRKDAAFRNWITADGSAGPSGIGGFKAEAGRYHLYVSLACPWAHRTLIMRSLKGLEDMISVSVVHWLMLENGWTFADGPGVVPDTVYHARFMHQIYSEADPYYTGRVTVPVLWDKHARTIVNNESSEIIRMLNSAFDAIGAKSGDYYPEALRGDIDAVNARIYDTLNNGVYKAGFATTQEAYEDAIIPLFDTLDWLEQRLVDRRFLLGDSLTEADIRLFTTLIRFDAVYAGHFKCDMRRIADYPHLSAYTRDIYQWWPGIATTVNFEHIRRHYYESHRSINPTGIVPVGPRLDFTAPHGREHLAEASTPPLHHRHSSWSAA
jgi:glutathionyl-hydroquinone reductase